MMNNKIKKRFKKSKITLVSIVIIILSLLVVFMLVRESGKTSLEEHGDNYVPKLHLEIMEASGQTNQAQTEEALEDGQIQYKNNIYEYNENILTFLCLGVDSRQAIDRVKTPGKGGQADTVMLVTLNPDTKEMKMIHISRDTIVDVEMYDTVGIYSETKGLQLALQYAYGDGKELSCELMEQAVSDLFYGIPIHGYAAIDINAVGELNEAIGGVELTVIEDLSRFDAELALGNTLTLSGRQALHYVQERQMDADELGANNLRMDRQKQFLTAFVDKVTKELKKDITKGIDLYNIALNHMITSISMDEVTYLSTLILDYNFTEKDMVSVEGELQKEGKYEEFIIDEEALYELIIEIFYKEVEK